MISGGPLWIDGSFVHVCACMGEREGELTKVKLVLQPSRDLHKTEIRNPILKNKNYHHHPTSHTWITYFQPSIVLLPHVLNQGIIWTATEPKFLTSPPQCKSQMWGFRCSRKHLHPCRLPEAQSCVACMLLIWQPASSTVTGHYSVSSLLPRTMD